MYQIYCNKKPRYKVDTKDEALCIIRERNWHNHEYLGDYTEWWTYEEVA